MWTDWWLRLRSLVRGSAVDREIDEELAWHIEQHIAKSLARGIDRAEAVRLAQLDLGGVEQIKEAHREARGITPVADLLRDVRYACRTLARLPGFTTAATLLLALVIAATTIVFTVIHSVLLTALPYPQAGELLTLGAVSETSGEAWGYSNPDFRDLAGMSRTFTAAAWVSASGTISAPGDPEHVEARQVSAELFAVLNKSLAQGRMFLPEEDRPNGDPVAIISDQLWRRRFNAANDAIGQRLVFEGKPYTIVGIVPAGFDLRGLPDVYIPLGQTTELRMQNREARFVHVLARLRQGATIADARSELADIGASLATRYPTSNVGRRFIASPLLQEVVGDVGDSLWLLFAAVGVLLSIACVNIASLLLARAKAREAEMATRAALGASRGRLIRQCLTESAVLGLLGGTLGVFLATAGLEPFLALWPGELPRSAEVRLDWTVLMIVLVGSLLCGLGFGLIPALRAPLAVINDALRSGGRSLIRTSSRTHRSLIVIELTLAIVLLVTAGTLVQTFVTLSSLDAGIDTQNVVVARVALAPGVLADPSTIRNAWAEVLEQARHQPDVEAVALTDIVPMRPGENTLPYSTTVLIRPANESPVGLASSVTPEYLRVMGIPLRAGRFITDQDRGNSPPVVVIDESLALHAFGRIDVVGRTLWVPAISPSAIPIVGVVGHVRHWGLARDDGSPVRDQMYYAFDQVPPRLLRLFSTFMSVAMRTPRADAVAARLQANDDRVFGGHAIYEVRTMEQLVSRSVARQRFLVTLFTALGGIALVLACVGVYGVLAYLTSERAAEFGVRLALGATPHDLFRLVLHQSARLILVSIAIGSAAAWAAGLAIERLIAGTQTTKPMTLVATVTALATAALLASLLPALRAGRINPVQVLRKT